MRSFLWVLPLLVGACGSKGDECQQFVDKSRTVLEEMAKSAGTSLTSEQVTAMVKQCRDRGGDHREDKALFDCVLAANGQPAVAACWEAGMKAYRDTASSGRAGGDRQKPPWQRDAEIVLNRLAKNAKAYFLMSGAFPEGSAPLSPACCGQPQHRCDSSTIPFTGVWEQLEFRIDENHHLQLSYEGTKDSFTVKALLDVDCDEEKIEYTVVGKVVGENPVVEITLTGRD